MKNILKISILFFFTITLMVVFLIYFYQELYRYQNVVKLQQRTYQFLIELEGLKNNIANIERFQRNYFLTDDRAYYNSYKIFFNQSKKNIQSLSYQIDAENVELFSNLKTLIDKRFNLYEKIESVYQTTHLKGIKQFIIINKTRILSAEIDAMINRLNASEKIQLNQKINDAQKISDRVYISLFTGGAFALFFLLLLFLLLVREIQSHAESEKQFKALFESAPDALISVDREGSISLVNNQTEQIFGYNRHELIGKKIEKLIPKRFKDVHVKHRNKYLEKPAVRQMGAGLNLYGLRKNGDEFPVEVSLSPLSSSDQYFVISAIRDISERKLADEKILETMQMKTNFISTVSHELRTPLTSIKESLAIIEETGQLNEEQKDFLLTARRNVDRLVRLINQVLDFSKFEAARMKLVFEESDLNQLISEIKKIFDPVAVSKNLELVLNLDLALPTLYLDKDKITQVLTNLVSNAIKFSQNGKIIIQTIKEDHSVRVSVIDEGIGIKKEDLPHLFKPFAQLSSDKIGKPIGTGLGLAISKQIIDYHHGQIGIESVSGKGSTFFFSLPIKKTEGNH